MKQFLAKPSTVAVLDGSFQKRQKFIPHGEVLETSMEAAVAAAVSLDADDDDDMDDDPPNDADVSREEDEHFANSIDTLLKDAKEDFGNFHLDDDEEDAILAGGGGSTKTGGDDNDLADMAADLDEMMKEADKELAELMNS
jgi:hypothetical protein